jgi:hypothetical protein
MSTANRFLNIEFGNSDDYSQGTVDSTAAIFFCDDYTWAVDASGGLVYESAHGRAPASYMTRRPSFRAVLLRRGITSESRFDPAKTAYVFTIGSREWLLWRNYKSTIMVVNRSTSRSGLSEGRASRGYWSCRKLHFCTSSHLLPGR